MPRTATNSLTLALALTLSAGLAACSHEPTIGFRLASTSPATGRQPMKLAAGDTTFYVSDSSVLSDEDIVSVRRLPSPDKLLLDVQLTPEGSARLKNATSSHIGERLALVIDSRLLSAPLIKTAVGGEKLMVGAVNLPKELVTEAASTVEARWPQK